MCSDIVNTTQEPTPSMERDAVLERMAMALAAEFYESQGPHGFEDSGLYAAECWGEFAKATADALSASGLLAENERLRAALHEIESLNINSGEQITILAAAKAVNLAHQALLVKEPRSCAPSPSPSPSRCCCGQWR